MRATRLPAPPGPPPAPQVGRALSARVMDLATAKAEVEGAQVSDELVAGVIEQVVLEERNQRLVGMHDSAVCSRPPVHAF